MLAVQAARGLLKLEKDPWRRLLPPGVRRPRCVQADRQRILERVNATSQQLNAMNAALQKQQQQEQQRQ